MSENDDFTVVGIDEESGERWAEWYRAPDWKKAEEMAPSHVSVAGVFKGKLTAEDA